VKQSWISIIGSRDYDISGANQSVPPSITTIAQSLAKLNRFTGHTRRLYSVAEHSLLCKDLAAYAGEGKDIQLCMLLHDAGESITGDVSSPVKELLGSLWKQYEAKIEQHIWRGLHPDLPGMMWKYRESIRYYDLLALYLERRDITDFAAERQLSWPVLDNPLLIDKARIHPQLPQDELHWSRWADRMISAWHELRPDN